MVAGSVVVAGEEEEERGGLFLAVVVLVVAGAVDVVTGRGFRVDLGLLVLGVVVVVLGGDTLVLVVLGGDTLVLVILGGDTLVLVAVVTAADVVSMRGTGNLLEVAGLEVVEGLGLGCVGIDC